VVILDTLFGVTKIPDRNNLKKERFILAHGIPGFSSWSVDPLCWHSISWQQKHVAEKSCFSVCDGQEKRNRERERERERERQRQREADWSPYITFKDMTSEINSSS
jgi:hypothetical protein